MAILLIGRVIPIIFILPVQSLLLEHLQFYPTDNQKTGLSITSEIQGSIEWVESSNSSLEIFVYILRGQEADYTIIHEKFDDVRVKTNFSEDKIAISVIRDIRDINNGLLVSSAQRSSGSRTVMKTLQSLSLALTVMALLAGRKLSFILMLMLYLTYNLDYCASHTQNDINCKIVVFYPKYYKFKEIDINMITCTNGTRIPRQLIEKSGTVSCHSLTLEATEENGCQSCCYGNGFCGPDNQCHCDPDFDPSYNCGRRFSPKTKLYLSELDQRLAKITTLDGTTFYFRGRKRTSGKVKSINNIVMETTKGDYFELNLNGGKRPTGMQFRNATDTMSLRHTNMCKITISGSKPDVVYSLDADLCADSIDFIRLETSSTASNQTNSSRSLSSENIVHHAEEGSETGRKFGVFYTRKGHKHLEIPVKIESCDPNSLTPRVVAEVSSQSDPATEPVKFEVRKPKGYGSHYLVRLPLAHAQKLGALEQVTQKETVCKSFHKALTQTCDYLTQLKDLALSRSFCDQKRTNYTNVNGSGIPEAGNIPSDKLCSLYYDAVAGICKVAYDWPSDGECSFFIDNFESFYVSTNDTVTLQAVYPESRTLQSNTYTIDIDITINSKDSNEVVLFDRHFRPKLTQAIILPRRPRPSHGYAVKMEYKCATPSTLVHMTVTGSDSYSQEVVCRGPQECNCCVLYVAGGHFNVSDSIQVSLTDTVSGAREAKNFTIDF